MKTNRFFSIIFLLLFALNANSAVVVINQTGSSFSPSNLTVNIGDVVRWVWSSGNHTTTSKTVPTGAATWDSPLTSSSTSFEYTVTVAGTYTYVCSIHESMGMTGSFTTNVSSGINEVDLSRAISIFPNPAKSFINIKTTENGELVLSDVLGRSIRNYQLSELTQSQDLYTLDLNDLVEGIYIISFLPANSKKRTSLKFIKK